jgi:hypothetical protein
MQRQTSFLMHKTASRVYRQWAEMRDGCTRLWMQVAAKMLAPSVRCGRASVHRWPSPVAASMLQDISKRGTLHESSLYIMLATSDANCAMYKSCFGPELLYNRNSTDGLQRWCIRHIKARITAALASVGRVQLITQYYSERAVERPPLPRGL